MDLSAGFDWPNPFGLKAADFEYDMDSYEVALRFLSDLASGSLESRALSANGGSDAMLREWERAPKFRRVLHKCRSAGAENRRYLGLSEFEDDPEYDGIDEPLADERPSTSGQRFIPL